MLVSSIFKMLASFSNIEVAAISTWDGINDSFLELHIGFWLQVTEMIEQRFALLRYEAHLKIP